jgi:hypothetical protein
VAPRLRRRVRPDPIRQDGGACDFRAPAWNGDILERGRLMSIRSACVLAFALALAASPAGRGQQSSDAMPRVCVVPFAP